MLNETEEASILLKNNYNAPSLTELKKRLSIFYMCSQACNDYKSGKDSAIIQDIDVVIDFYCRFTARMSKLMKIIRTHN